MSEFVVIGSVLGGRSTINWFASVGLSFVQSMGVAVSCKCVE